MRVSAALGGAVLVAFLICAFTPLPNVVAARLGIPSQIGPADAVVVLGAGSAAGDGLPDGASLRRVVLGVALLRRALAPLLILSGTPAELEARERLVRELGVPDRAIIAMTTWTTRGEAARLREVAPAGVRTILLVTDAQHMIRAERLFRRAGFAVRPAIAEDIAADTGSAEARLGLTRVMAGEAVARLYHRVAGYL
jgi:uncharacterized SAM-binding protein YcdF (DUF218 family)